MDQELITKKELLEITGISYGALYRWKRMKLLPDEWFIHKSTFTGHETFLPRDKVLERVQEIQTMKETMSLEEIARHFQPGPPGEVKMSPQEAAAAGIAVPAIISQYLSYKPLEEFSYQDLLGLYTFGSLLMEGQVSREEAFELSEAAIDAGDLAEPVVYLVRKFGVGLCVTAAEMQNVKFDRQSTLALTLRVSEKKAALGTLLSGKGVKL